MAVIWTESANGREGDNRKGNELIRRGSEDSFFRLKIKMVVGMSAKKTVEDEKERKKDCFISTSVEFPFEIVVHPFLDRKLKTKE